MTEVFELIREWSGAGVTCQLDRLMTLPSAGSDEGSGIPEDPWLLTGTTELRYHLRAIEDLHAMLVEYGDWIRLGSADE